MWCHTLQLWAASSNVMSLRWCRSMLPSVHVQKEVGAFSSRKQAKLFSVWPRLRGLIFVKCVFSFCVKMQYHIIIQYVLQRWSLSWYMLIIYTGALLVITCKLYPHLHHCKYATCLTSYTYTCLSIERERGNHVCIYKYAYDILKVRHPPSPSLAWRLHVLVRIPRCLGMLAGAVAWDYTWGAASHWEITIERIWSYKWDGLIYVRI